MIGPIRVIAGQTGKLLILKTDYSEYSLAYSCIDLLIPIGMSDVFTHLTVLKDNCNF